MAHRILQSPFAVLSWCGEMAMERKTRLRECGLLRRTFDMLKPMYTAGDPSLWFFSTHVALHKQSTHI